MPVSKNKDNIVYIREEAEDDYSDDDLFKISSWGADLSFRELISRYQDGELLKPELQRKYVWSRTDASRFIESLLLGLPVPSIFLAQTPAETMLIVDGFQRIMTVYDYVKGIFSGDGKSFKLSRSEKINPKWRGKVFEELDDQEKRRIRNTTIHAIIFVQDQPSDNDTSLYQIFERINTSGRSLLPQEIRNCVYQGSFNTLLIELNQLPQWRKLYGNQFEDGRMRDMEFILRFFALQPESLSSTTSERLSLKKHLNDYMGTHRNLNPQQAALLRSRFRDTIEFIHETWGDGAFQNVSPTHPDRLVKKFSPTIFDSIAVATSIALEKGLTRGLKSPSMKRLDLLKDDDYKRSIYQETMTLKSINTRISKALHILYGG